METAMEIDLTRVVEIEYFCPTCVTKFCVYHIDESRSTCCCWCGGVVIRTGRVARVEGDVVVTYSDEMEVSRRSKPE